MRKDLEEVVRGLLATSAETGEISLDAIGEALGTTAVSTDDVDTVLTALERRGRRIVAPEGGGGEERLRQVVVAARHLTAELGRRPSVAEIAQRSRLSEGDVRQALALAKVIQR